MFRAQNISGEKIPFVGAALAAAETAFATKAPPTKILIHILRTATVAVFYWIVKELAQLWTSFDLTVQEGLAELDALCSTEVSIAGGGCFHRIPEPRELSRPLLEAADVKLPGIFPSKGIRAATKKKLPSRRKVDLLSPTASQNYAL